jgi:molybdopterin molybdotransferase
LVETFRRPRVRIVALGDELSQPGSARHHLQSIPDSVSFGVAALAERFGATNLSVLRLKDNLALIQSAAEDASSDADLVVVTGGASVGERDYAKQMFAERGLELIFSKIAIKPGKPAWFGRAGDTLILGLPGNPTSALVTARLLMAPLLAKLQGRDMRQVLQWKRAALLHGVAPCGDRETFHRGSFEDCRASVSRSADSGAQRALARASILIRQPANSPALNAGAIVDVLEF